MSGRTCLSIQSGARKLERLPCLKYYNVMKQKSRFTLGPNPAKNTDYMKKDFN